MAPRPRIDLRREDPIISLASVTSSQIRHLRSWRNGGPSVPRPTLVIGVGGTGQKTLHRLKERLTAHHAGSGPRPPVKLLAFDTDTQETPEKLDPTEFTHLQIHGGEFQKILQGLKEHRPEIAEWFPDAARYPGLLNIRNLRDGAAQVRACGRIVFFDNADAIQRAIQIQLEALNRMVSQMVHGGQTPSNVPHQLDSVDIFIVSSLSGGTGSGMCLDFAGLVRGEFAAHSPNIYGIFVQPDVFESVVPTKHLIKIAANNYAALKEINQFMRPGASYKLDYSRTKREPAACPLFDAVFLMGKFNHRGVPLENLGHAAVVAGDVIHDFAMEGLGSTFPKTNVNEAFDGATTMIAKNGLRTWVSSCGTHEVVWPVEEIRSYWTLRESVVTLERLLGDIPSWERSFESLRQERLQKASQDRDQEKIEELKSQRSTLDGCGLREFRQLGYPELAQEFTAKKRIPEKVRGPEGVLAMRFKLTPSQVQDGLFLMHEFKKGLDLNTFEGQKLPQIERGLKAWAEGKQARIDAIEKGEGGSSGTSLSQKIKKATKVASQQISESVQRYLDEPRERGIPYVLHFLNQLHESMEGFVARLKSESSNHTRTENSRAKELEKKMAQVNKWSQSILGNIFRRDVASLEIIETGHAMQAARLQRILNEHAITLYSGLLEVIEKEFQTVSNLVGSVRTAAASLNRKHPEVLQNLQSTRAGETRISNGPDHVRSYFKQYVEKLELPTRVTLRVSAWRESSADEIGRDVVDVVGERLFDEVGQQRILDYASPEERAQEQDRLVDLLRAKSGAFLRSNSGAERFNPFELVQITCGYDKKVVDFTSGVPWTGVATQYPDGCGHRVRLTHIYMGHPLHVIEGIEHGFQAYETLVMQRSEANRIPVHLFANGLEFPEIAGMELFPDGRLLLNLAAKQEDPLPLSETTPAGMHNEKKRPTPVLFKANGTYCWWKTRTAEDGTLLEIRILKDESSEDELVHRLSRDPVLSTLIQDRIWASMSLVPKEQLQRAFPNPRFLTRWLKEQVELKFGRSFFPGQF